MMEKLTISVDSVRLYANHGVFEQEQIVGNEFSVSVSVVVPASDELLNDELSDTISYADIYDIILYEMKITSKLIENVGYRILHSIKERWNDVERITVKIEKLAPPIAGIDGKTSILLEFVKK